MTITTQQARLRFTTIPSRLQDAMFSPQTDEIMAGIADQYHLDDMKSGVIGKIAGWVFLGFIHPGDAAREIQQQLNLSQQIAQEISKSLDAKVFDPLRTELSVAYAPAPSSSEEEIPAGPKIIQEIQSARPAPKAAATFVPRPPAAEVISESFTASPKFSAVPFASNRNTPAPPPQPNKPDPNKGWSTRTPQNPVVTLGAITPAVPSPSSAGMPTGNPPVAGMQKPNANSTPTSAAKSMSEFDRLGFSTKNASSPARPPMPSTPTPPAQAATPASIPTPKPPGAPKAPAPASVPNPAPVMLHEISASSAQSPEFHVNMGMQNQMGSGAARPTSMPTRPAMLEFGGASKNPPAQAAVHYSEYKASAPASASQNPGNTPRQITEIKDMAGPAASAAAMPTPPKPPVPPAVNPAEKVHVQDFLSPEK